MIITDYIKTLKEAVKDTPYTTFKDLIKIANNFEFVNKQEILSHFESILIKEEKNLILLKYDTKKMFHSKWDEFYKTVRGIVIDWVENKIVLYPFNKFFELNEDKTSQLSLLKKEISNGNGVIEVTEKIDGSLISIRYYNNQIIISSLGSLVGLHINKAKEIINKSESLKQIIIDNPQYTFIFELKVSDLPQIIKYNEDTLTLIGMRNMENYHLLSRKEMVSLLNTDLISIVEIFEKTLDEILEYMESPTADTEGYIIRVNQLMIKMKTKNFILANRFFGEPERNLNTLVEVINDNRLIREMIRKDYLESFDVGIKMIQRYLLSKEGNNLQEIFDSFSPDIPKDTFIWKARELYPEKAQMLINMKLGKYHRLDKTDVKYLRKFAEYLTCVSSYKYAELNNLTIDEVNKKIECGEIEYLKSFPDNLHPEKTVYIIHKWQFKDLSKVKYTPSNK